MDSSLRYCLESGSGRILNCQDVTGLILQAKEASVAAASEPSQSDKLLFQTSVLNKAILIKDVKAFHNLDGSVYSAKIGTKVYIPFDAKNPLAGGRSVFFGTRDYGEMLADLYDVKRDDLNAQIVADSEVLKLLDTIPTFAPFLLKDRLEHAGIQVSPLYYDIDAEEWARVESFIRLRFVTIVRAVMPGTGDGGQNYLERLLNKLWDLNDIESLRNLASAFKLPEDNCIDIFYSWKGVLFFSYEYARRQVAIKGFLEWLFSKEAQGRYMPANIRKEIMERTQIVRDRAARVRTALVQEFSQYEGGFDDLFVNNKGPDRFIGFLKDASRHFQTIGYSFGCLNHAAEIWEQTIKKFPVGGLDYLGLLDLLKTLDDVLRIEQPRLAA